jgi:DNA topoisomerase-1
MSLVLPKPLLRNGDKSRCAGTPLDYPADPVESAHAAGLRYILDTGPGIRRERRGQDFIYIGVGGKPIRDPKELQRIKAIGIPPAYTDVWICPFANGHIQATGRDAKGRKQYRYHPRWREVRDSAKYDRTIVFAEALPAIRKRVERDLAHKSMSREKLLAVVVRLLETTHIRVGNEEYLKANNSVGLTTLRNSNVDISGATIHFHFRGKSGKTHRIDLKDRRLARIVQRCQELPGQDLFEYQDDEGNYRAISSTNVNEYLRETTGEDFTAKDFRTWAGTVLAALSLFVCGAFNSQSEAKKNITRAIAEVAEQLGNTPAICRKCYVHPQVIESYLEGTLEEALSHISSPLKADLSSFQRPEEVAVVTLLRKRMASNKVNLAGA